MDALFDDILAATPVSPEAGATLGHSVEGAPVKGFRFGRAGLRVSLLGGCHADEPVGPRLLRHLAAYLRRLDGSHPLLRGREWWIVPHINPDGERRNRSWHGDDDEAYDLVRYLRGVVREPPGPDVEFGFPRDEGDAEARPETRAVYGWWRGAGGPFDLHASLHGMAFAAGPWFLIDAAWQDRCEGLKARCAAAVDEMGYALHDVERRGEKGFVRLGKGFCTRPDAGAMRRHFVALGDDATAALFRPSSMETIRNLGGDALTIVSEMPLFITPGVGETLGPPDPVAEEWRTTIRTWQGMASDDAAARTIGEEAEARGLVAMPVRDQMALQWRFIVAALAEAEAARTDPA